MVKCIPYIIMKGAFSYVKQNFASSTEFLIYFLINS